MLPRSILAGALILTVSSASQAGPLPGQATAEREDRPIATAPYTAPTGKVVPRPGALASVETGNIEKRTKRQEEDDRLTRGICTGC